jgi:DNA-binding beta-propeller fold protein YncE
MADDGITNTRGPDGVGKGVFVGRDHRAIEVVGSEEGFFASTVLGVSYDNRDLGWRHREVESSLIMHIPFKLAAVVSVLGIALAGNRSAAAQIVVSANDNKAVLVDGVNVVPSPTAPDTVTILDASTSPPRVLAELQVPNSVVGPPQNVAISPDGTLAVVASAVKLDPADGTKTVPDNRVSVIDLRATPIAVTMTAEAGAGASGVAFTPDGQLLLVANRIDGTVSVFRAADRRLTPLSTIDLGAPQSGPSQVAVTPDGRRALVTRNNDHLVSVLSISGSIVSYTRTDIVAGLKPYGLEIAPAGDVAVVASIGSGGTGSVDTLAVVDLDGATPRTVDYVNVGVIPEAVAISPNGRFVAVTVMNGTNAPPTSPIYRDFGRLRVFSLSGRALTPVTETRIGRWCQGVAWTSDSRSILAQCMTEREIQVFGFDGKALAKRDSIKVNGAPAGIRAAGR